LQGAQHARERKLAQSLLSFKSAGLPLPWKQSLPVPDGSPPPSRAALLLRDNVLHRSQIERAYLKAIGLARYEVLIANAYFLPGMKLRHALIDAAARGVRVRLLLQGKIEYRMQYHATRWIYQQFLKYGIEIYEYRKSFMHSKVAVIDQEWATVGSSNIDPFSLLLAREANVMVRDHFFAEELRASIMQSVQDGAAKISPQSWVRGNLRHRICSWMVYGVLRIVLGMIGRAEDWRK
jgi:cardiolipin synthase